MSNTRIKFIFWLMTICIVAINAFQGYWLLTTYRLNRTQFKQTVQETLFQVVEGEQIARANAMFPRDLQKLGAPGPPSLPRSRMVFRRFHTDPDLTMNADTETSKAGQEDTLAHRISKMLVMGWSEGGQIDKRKLFQAYRDALQKRGIQTGFLLDTLRIIPRSDGGNTFFVHKPEVGLKASKQFRTFPVPINPVRNLHVQATFDMPFVYLFKKMSGLLAASFLLLVLTTGCLIYMLRTILRQKRLSEIKNDFINNMTHELKTPIATVTAAVEAMMHYGVLDNPEKTNSYLTISHNNLGRLSELVEKVLNLAVEEKQEMQLHYESVNLQQLVSGIMETYLLRASKPLHFEHNIPVSAIVSVDRIHFANVLSNLVDNAIKYSHDQVSIVFSYKSEGKNWQLTVEDNGLGIPKQYQLAIFDRFFRVPTGDLHPVKGFGLGLAYVQKVMERHGGKIDLVSEVGKGSAFILKL